MRAANRKHPGAATEVERSEYAAQPGLSPRQNQILDLLRAGKVNKEIANELGIGLGTVKQHVVALFKKLDVSNRTMAVTRGMQIPPASRSGTVSTLESETLLEYRPCLILSAVLDEAEPQEISNTLQRILARFAAEHDALFLARKGDAGDLIIGIQRASEQDFFLALRAARTLFRALRSDRRDVENLRGGLTAGLAIASMNRKGGWSGEAIASIAISQGREFAQSALPGQLHIAPAARELLCVQSPNSAGPVPESIPFNSLENLPWQPGTVETLPLGRDVELRLIDEFLGQSKPETGSVLHISGETGMGKSRLCRYASEKTIEFGGMVHHYVCRPDHDVENPFVTTDGFSTPRFVVSDCIARPASHRPETIIIDDCHFLSPKEFAAMSSLAASAYGKNIVLAARRFVDLDASPHSVIRLRRLAPELIEKLAIGAVGRSLPRTRIASIVRRAAGVPLFALEIGRQRKPDMLPLSLRALIGARLDSLGLDRALLRRIARRRAAADVPSLAREMNESQEIVQKEVMLAVAAGVLEQEGSGKLRFLHPLLRQAVDLSGVE